MPFLTRTSDYSGTSGFNVYGIISDFRLVFFFSTLSLCPGHEKNPIGFLLGSRYDNDPIDISKSVGVR